MEDISAVNRALPDYIGFVFASSRRQIDEKTARMLKKHLDARIKAVGVFVNQKIEFVADLYRNGVIDIAQLHGDEDSGYIERLKERCGCQIIKAIGIGDNLPPENIGLKTGLIDYYLFDYLSGQRGGAGKTFDWDVLKKYSGPPFFLAGGLNLANIPYAINSLDPFCIDVSSGAETDGRKDKDKIDQIVRLCR